MKVNFLIGKKQIVLSALVVILGGAIYVNYLYADKDAGFPITQSVSTSANTTEKENKNYGDAQLVNSNIESGSDYFKKANLEKSKTREEAVQTVKAVLEKADISEEEKNMATTKMNEITKQIEDEGKIENLIKSKGFDECVVYLDNDAANVVVKTDGLTAEQAAQIKNIILSQKEVLGENISITEVK